MPFYVRKSVRFGPLRLNLSSSGIGASVGVKGFRVGTGPRGHYVHAGRGGVYYRHTFGKGDGRREPPQHRQRPPALETPLRGTLGEMVEISSGGVGDMADETAADLLSELKAKQRRMRFAGATFWTLVAAGGSAIYVGDQWAPHLLSALTALARVFGVAIHPMQALGAAAAAGLLLVFWVRRIDKRRKTTPILYNFDPQTEAEVTRIWEDLVAIRSARNLWHVPAAGRADPKYNAGASINIKRDSIRPEYAPPEGVKTNIPVFRLPAGVETLYFFPDRLLIFTPRGVGAVAYRDLHVSVGITRFVESEAVPKDAEVVGRTWQFTNKAGGPDRRFKSNRQFPIALYDELELTSSSGLNECFHVSKNGLAARLASAVSALALVSESKFDGTEVPPAPALSPDAETEALVLAPEREPAALLPTPEPEPAPLVPQPEPEAVAPAPEAAETPAAVAAPTAPTSTVDLPELSEPEPIILSKRSEWRSARATSGWPDLLRHVEDLADDGPCTERQKAALVDLGLGEPPSLSKKQASAFLSARSFAEGVIYRRIGAINGYPGEREIEAALVSFIVATRPIRDRAIKWNQRSFARGGSSSGIPSPKRDEHFDRVDEELERLLR